MNQLGGCLPADIRGELSRGLPQPQGPQLLEQPPGSFLMGFPLVSADPGCEWDTGTEPKAAP